MPLSIPLLVISGPTATGKTEAAIRVARAVGGEIISADSMQIYRHLDIGTAKPTASERSMARFHLVDCVEIDEPYTVADFQRDARAAIHRTWGKGLLPILCGGTGLYIRAVLEGFAFPTAEPARQGTVRAELEQQLQVEGNGAMHARLCEVDPVAGARIQPADTKRIVRALEVFLLTGEPISAQQRVDAPLGVNYNVCHFVLTRPRPTLYEAIDRRVDRMLQAGWVDEVRWVLAQGYDPALQSLQAIGYRHLLNWLRRDLPGAGAAAQARGAGFAARQEPSDGPADLSDVIETIKRDTRRFAKRQLTWFRREAGAHWIEWEDVGHYVSGGRQLIAATHQLQSRAAGPVGQRSAGMEDST